MMPSILRENLFDDFMNFGFPEFDRPYNRGSVQNLMRTDVREVGDKYEIDIELPGFKKEDVKAQLKDGYLTISAVKDADNGQKDDNGRYIRRERFSGSVSRQFFVGKNITESDIHAKFENGVLKLTVPREDHKKVEENRYISIEG